ncbi:MAG: hypothetical protein H6747_04980 [Deltaproteobacteria bacterium]|nr:hypothetical protein [Deltaproteobacteria bacterium]
MKRLLHTLMPTLLLLLGVAVGTGLTLFAAQQGTLEQLGFTTGEANAGDGGDAGADAAAEGGEDDGLSLGRTVRLLQGASARLRGPSKTIYLNREGVVLQGGVDEAAQNRSSVVKASGYTRLVLPGYNGTDRGWKALVRCVEDRFAPFDVRVTDQRPTAIEDYVMAVFGGSARELGYSKKDAAGVGGLAPFNGKPIGRAVVFVFTATLKNRKEDACDTAAMEIAHAYGLDHSFHCRDVMTYKKRCGSRRFLDEAVPCGEDEPRTCTGGAAKQNSFVALRTLLGAHNGKREALTSLRDPNAPADGSGTSAGVVHDHGDGKLHKH